MPLGWPGGHCACPGAVAKDKPHRVCGCGSGTTPRVCSCSWPGDHGASSSAVSYSVTGSWPTLRFILMRKSIKVHTQAPLMRSLTPSGFFSRRQMASVLAPCPNWPMVFPNDAAWLLVLLWVSTRVAFLSALAQSRRLLCSGSSQLMRCAPSIKKHHYASAWSGRRSHTGISFVVQMTK